MRLLVIVLALALAFPAGAKEPAQLLEGQRAPFTGALCDRECAARIAAKITAAQVSRDACLAELNKKPATVGPSAWLIAGVLVAGIVVGAAAVVYVQK